MSTSTLSADQARTELYSIMKQDAPFAQKAEQALELGQRYLGVETSQLTQIDMDRDYWKALVSTDQPDGTFPAALVLDLGSTYCRRTVEEGPIALHDAATQGWADDPAYAEHGFGTYHDTTLMIDDKPYGTVCFVSTDARGEPFSDEETMFAELITRMLEHELQHNRTQAKVERLDQFASIVSHDLRNPLNIAQGNINIERERRGDSEQLATADRALDRMNDLISDVLAIARQGRDVTETTYVSLSDVVQDCWAAVDTSEAELRIETDCGFQADPQRIYHLFENLFRNAVEHGGMAVTVQVGPLPAGDDFYVENSGPPVPVDVREEIFETGYSTGGTGIGLGLAIVEGIVAAHGWRISVTEGRLGARFEIHDVIIQ